MRLQARSAFSPATVTAVFRQFIAKIITTALILCAFPEAKAQEGKQTIEATAIVPKKR
jgi:hypothetical protein